MSYSNDGTNLYAAMNAHEDNAHVPNPTGRSYGVSNAQVAGADLDPSTPNVVIRAGSKLVVTPTTVRDTDLVVRQGMELTVFAARQAGLLGPFDDAAQEAPQRVPEAAKETPDEEPHINANEAQMGFDELALSAGDDVAEAVTTDLVQALVSGHGQIDGDTVKALAEKAGMPVDTFTKISQSALTAQDKAVRQAIGMDSYRFLQSAYDFDKELQKDMGALIMRTGTTGATPTQWRALAQKYLTKHQGK